MKPRTEERLKADVGRRIAEVRAERDRTQQWLAERLDMSPQYVRRVESGGANLSLASMVKFARALGVDAATLLERPTSRKRPKPGRPRKG